MDLTRSYLISLFLCISVINEIPRVTCQDEEGSQCLPKQAFLALLRLPEISSNLAAYSRTSRIIQDAKNHNDFAHLKASAEDNDDTEICIPGALYLELFRDPSIRGHLTSIGRTQRVPDYSASRPLDDSEEVDSKDALADAEKRSIATLAKNDDLPISIQDRDENQDDDTKRSYMTRFDLPSGESLDAMVRALAEEESRRSLQDYPLPSGEFDTDSLVRDYTLGKRNIGSLARDYALPVGRRNLASLARDSGLPSGKRNIGSLAREQMWPYAMGKRNVASLARVYMLPQGKRNIAALARDYALPYGKRYLASVARSGGIPAVMDYEEERKRNIASIARSAGRSRFAKRSPGLSAGGIRGPLVLRTFGQGRRTGVFDGATTDAQAKNRSGLRMNVPERRTKRQIDFSDEYPLPVMQNANALDYEEMLEALTGQYPNAEKRFMGRIPQMGPRPTTPPTRWLGR